MRDHRGDRDWPVLGDVVGHGLELRKRHARDRFDEESMMPPQVSPTENASSSVIP